MTNTGRRSTAASEGDIMQTGKKHTGRTIAAAVVVAAAAVLIGAGIGATSTQQMSACATEDSAGPCYWDAGTRSNGTGLSFYVDGAQVVHYVADTERAAR